MNLNKKTENKMNSKPETAEVITSLPSFIFSGLPPARTMVIPPQSANKKAMPLPMAIDQPKIHLTNSAGSVGIQPRAVKTSLELVHELLEATHPTPIPGLFSQE